MTKKPGKRRKHHGLPELHSGFYQHYKGDFYRVYGYASNSTNAGDDEVMVVYSSCSVVPGLPLRVRVADEFFEWVNPHGFPITPEDDRATEGSAKRARELGYRPRFEWHGNKLEAEDMPGYQPIVL